MDTLVNFNRVDLGKEAPIDVPLTLFVEPSGFCNFKCRFCVQSDAAHPMKKSNMPLSTFKKIVDDIDNNNWVIKKFRFCGFGESFVNPDFIKMLQYLDDKRGGGGG